MIIMPGVSALLSLLLISILFRRPLSQRSPKAMEQCTSTFAKPFEMTELTTSTLFADEWPNADIHCAARYWSYGAAGRIYMPGEVVASHHAAYTSLLNSSKPISRCCRLPMVSPHSGKAAAAPCPRAAGFPPA